MEDKNRSKSVRVTQINQRDRLRLRCTNIDILPRLLTDFRIQ